MSTTIDQRVVEMRFDNKQFESATSQSMSTIDKLKQKLNFKDAGKGLEGVSAAAKKVDMNSLAKGVEAVQVKFSSLQVIATTALANITNSAINAGKNLVSSFTIDPIVQGFQEYETQMNAVQTILTNTRTKGTTLDQVNEALAELNTYADQTIYNFTQMTENIGRFTAAGVDLDTSVNSIKGLANLAAASGSSANQAAMAMYQLSQALASGTIRLQDWISVENAGMGGELFQNALKRTAEHFGTDVDAMIAKYGTFRASLTEGGWLTVDVMTETLKQLSGAYTEAELISQGYTEAQAKEIVELANSAMDAATKVKTFTQLIGTMKEAVGSGWAQTWQLIIGDFEEAKELWTGISDFFTGENGIITKMSTARNTILEGALYGNPFSDLAKKIDSVTTSTDKMTKSTKDYSALADKIIQGDFGNGAERVEKLTKANYDYATAQNLVNEKLGSSVRHATDYKEAQDGVSKTTKTTAEDLVKLSDAQLVMMGFTMQEVDALRELEEQSERTGIPLNKLVENVDQLNGRTLLINTFKNAAQGLIQVFTAVSDGWRTAFWGDASEDEILSQKTERLYNLIAALHKFSQNLVMSDDTVENLTRTFQGLFAILDLVTTILGGGFKLAFEVVSKLLGAFDMDILDFTAMLGDAAVALRDFILDNEVVNKGFDLLASGIASAAKSIKGWIDSFLNLPIVQSAIESLKSGLSGLKDIGSDVIEGLKNGLQNGLTSIPEMLMEIGQKLIDAIKGILGINSPSTVMEEVGEFTIQGLINGLVSGAKTLFSTIGELFSGVIDFIAEFFDGVQFGNVLAAALSIGGLIFANKIAGIIESITAPFEGLGDVLSGVGSILDEAAKPIAKTIKSVSKVISGFALQLKAEAILSIAKAIAILAAAVLVLSQIPAGNLFKAVGALAALGVVLGGLSVAIGKFGPDKALSFSGVAAAIIGIAASMVLIAVALKKLESLDPNKLVQTIGTFAVIVAGMMALMASAGQVVKGPGSENVSKLGTMMLKLSASLLLMSAAIKILGGMDLGALVQGGIAVAGMAAIMAALTLVTKYAGKDVDKLGSMMLKLSAALVLMTVVIKLLGGMDPGKLNQGMIALITFAGIIGILTLITRLGGKDMDKLGTTLLAMSAAMLVLTVVIGLLSRMEVGDIIKGMVALTAFSGVVALLVSITKLAGKEAPQMAANLLAMSLAVGVLAAVAVLLSFIDLAGLAKGVVAVGVLSTFMALMIAATRGANDVKGNLIAMSVAIGLMAASVVALSFIEPGKLAGATAAMAILMGMFALVEKSAKNINGAMGSLIVMTVAVGLLGGILIAMGLLPLEGTLEKAAALSLLLISLSAAMLLASKAGSVSASAMAAIGVMTLALAGIAGVLILLDTFDVTPSLETAASLSVLLLSLSAACVILSTVGNAGVAAIKGAAALDAVIIVIGGLMAGIGALVTYFPQLEEFVNTGIGLLESIGYGIGSFVGNIVGGFLAGATSGLPEIATNLSTFMENLQPFIDGAKSIDESVVGAVGSLAAVILALTAADVVAGIASLFGLGDFSNLTDQLVPLGEAMKGFSDALGDDFNSSSVEAAAAAGQMLADLNDSLPPSDGVLQDFLGEKNFETWGEQLKSFGEAIVNFSETVDGNVSEDAVSAATNAGEMLAQLNEKIPPSDGALQDFLGEKNFETWGEKIVAFGEAIVDFSQTVDGNVSEEAVTAATNAGELLANLNEKIPTDDGALQDFLGSKDFETWGDKIVAFGEAIVSFSQEVDGNVSEEAVTAATNAGEMLTALNETLPESGGVMQWFFGSKDLEEFGTQLSAFGLGLSMFAIYAAGMDFEAVDSAVAAAKKINDLFVYLDENGLEGGLFGGNSTLSDFSGYLTDLSTGMNDFVDSLGGTDATELESAVTQISRLIGIFSALDTIDTSGMSSFGKALTELAKADIQGLISTYQDASSRVKAAVESLMNSMTMGVQGKESQVVEAVEKAIAEALNRIKSHNQDFNNSGREIVTQLSTGISSRLSEITKAFNDLIDNALKAFSSAEAQFNAAGNDIVSSVESGVRSGQSTLSGAFNSVLSAMVSSIRAKYSDFYSAGSYLVQGFAQGISSSTYMATARATAMANAAEAAAKNALGVHSPSRVFYEIGENVVKGFSYGVLESTTMVKDTGEELGDSMVDSAKEALDVEGDVSKLAEEVIGETFVNGIAEGITSDMSAEEAAEKKAENIATAFQNAMEKIDLSSDTLDLEQQLWDAINENTTTEAQKDAEQLKTLLKEYEYQNERVKLAEAEYYTMVQNFGEQSEKAQESYNSLLQQRIELANLSNQILDIKDAEVEREMDILDKRDEAIEHEYEIWKKQNENNLTEYKEGLVNLAQLTQQYEIQKQRVSTALSDYHAVLSMFGKDANETYEAYNEYLSQYQDLTDIFTELTEAREAQLQADSSESYKKYIDFLERNKDQLLSKGWDLEDIYDQALDYSATEGYDINKLIESMDSEIRGVIEETTKVVGNSLMASIQQTFSEAKPALAEQGTEIASSIGEGITAGTEKIAAATKEVVTAGVTSASSEDNVFMALGSQIANSFVAGFAGSLTGSSAQEGDDPMSTAGQSIVMILISGIESQSDALKKTFAALLEIMVEVAKQEQSSFEDAGEYVVVGFANGITNNTYLAEAKARAMARAAYEAAMSELDAHSPSRLFEEAGSFVPLGFARGISGAETAVRDSATSMADTAIETTKDTIARLVDVINSDVDTQPTIRPVLDLSEIEAGARRLNTTFSRNRALSVGSSMSRMNVAADDRQNGVTEPQNGQTYNFYQYNTSPKALSKVEIYRQTKNQFSTFERVTKV